MPTRPTVAIRLERPLRLARLGEFPQREIERVFLKLVDLDTRSGLQFIDITIAELPIAREAADAIVDSVVDNVRVPAFDQVANHRLNLWDVRGCVRLLIGLHHPEPAHRSMKLLIVAAHDRAPILTGFTRAVDAAVVDIGHVLHVGDAVALVNEIATQQIEEQKRPGVTQMRLR